MKLITIDWNGIIPDFGEDFEILGENSSDVPDGILSWNEVLPNFRSLREDSKILGIPFFVMQHGTMTEDITEYEINGVSPSADGIFVYTKRDKELYVKAGFSEERVHVVGCSILRDVKNESDGRTVVFFPTHSEKEPYKNLRNGEEAIKIWEELRKVEDISPVMKVLEGEHNHLGNEGNLIKSDRSKGKEHLDILFSLLKKAACIVVQDDGTVSKLAQWMDVPVLKVSKWNKELSEGCTEVELKDLKRWIHKSIFDPGYKTFERFLTSRKFLDRFDYEKMVKVMKDVMESRRLVHAL